MFPPLPGELPFTYDPSLTCGQLAGYISRGKVVLMTADLFVVGGAVGASWGGPAGWAAFLHVPSRGLSRKLVGNKTDSVQAEVDVLPIAAAIQWYYNEF